LSLPVVAASELGLEYGLLAFFDHLEKDPISPTKVLSRHCYYFHLCLRLLCVIFFHHRYHWRYFFYSSRHHWVTRACFDVGHV